MTVLMRKVRDGSSTVTFTVPGEKEGTVQEKSLVFHYEVNSTEYGSLRATFTRTEPDDIRLLLALARASGGRELVTRTIVRDLEAEAAGRLIEVEGIGFS